MLGRFIKKVRVMTVSIVATALIGTASVAGAEALRLGDNGEDIAEIQSRLANAGYDVVIDGDFGPATYEAVVSFQRENGLEADGMVGQYTYRLLMGRSMPEVSRGSNYVSRRVLTTAMRYMGVPYVFGGSSPYGFDCSGYIQYVFANCGVKLPRTADIQYEVGMPIDLDDLMPGDLVFFSTYEPGPSHVGIYVGEGNFIHASSGAGGVVITPMSKQFYRDCYLGARRVF